MRSFTAVRIAGTLLALAGMAGKTLLGAGGGGGSAGSGVLPAALHTR